MKDESAILEKLGIKELNQMQLDAMKAISSNDEVLLLSPTGTGKTLAFLLPLIAELDEESKVVQALILVPSRELAIQIEQVVREMGSGYKANAIYGGRSGFKDKLDLKHPPAILIGTPGRIADRFRRENISTDAIKTLVLDEFDKSLEVGFEEEMREIINALPALKKKILTSATQRMEVPAFVGITALKKLDYLSTDETNLKLCTVISPTQDKLQTLKNLIGYVGDANGMIFCNFKDSIQTVSTFLERQHISHACFHGGLEQIDRERALVKFRNGTHRLLVATDLAARGLDVPEMDFIIHYELPVKSHEFIHRNGRTARMHSDGIAYLLKWRDQLLPDFIQDATVLEIGHNHSPQDTKWKTLYISGGRKDKISKGDIAGLFFKQGGLEKDELGIIELKQDYAFVAVPAVKADSLIQQLNNSRLKKKKVRISILN